MGWCVWTSLNGKSTNVVNLNPNNMWIVRKVYSVTTPPHLFETVFLGLAKINKAEFSVFDDDLTEQIKSPAF